MESPMCPTPLIDLSVRVYSSTDPCVMCNVTKSQLDRAGIPFTELIAAEHPEIIEEVVALELPRQLPVVKVVNPHGEDMLWTGLSRENIVALKFLFSET